ncbi:hypothetical protein JNB50_13840 [Leifsonia sp. TF02-11]|nr:hypothetical protein [Leifsonia sp. TF02-11]
MKQQGHCPCGDFHEYTDGLVGTPIDRSTYDYAGEVIWSKNLPNLMAAAVRQIKRLALWSGVEPSELRLFSVYERQKRGSLHSHVLIAVTGNEQGFIRLASTIAKGWSSPTAEIPAGLVANYESTIVKSRLITSGLNANLRVPTAKWKNRIEHPATKFGKQYDFRILKADSETATEIRSYKQASSYVSKYLTKNQSAFAPVALKRLSAQQKHHFYDLRKTAMALLADYSLYVARVRTLERQRRAMFEVASEQLAFIQAELKRLRSRGVERSGIVDTLFDEWVTSTVTREGLKQTFDDLASLIGEQMNDEQVTLLSLISEAQEVEATVSLRSIKISLNRLANNAGFTGSLTIVSNWRKSISDLKQEMSLFKAEQMVDVQEPAVIAVELNIEKMSELRRERAKYSERNKSVIERTILWASNLKQKPSPIII